jgi:hypothetical protein
LGGVILAGSCALAFSQSADGSAHFSEYGVQRGSDGVDIADVLMSLQASGGVRQSIPQQPQVRQQIQPQSQLEPQQQSEQKLDQQNVSQPSHVSQACGKKVEVNFLDKGHAVYFGNNLNKTVYQELKARGGKAREQGLEYTVRVSEEGCSKTVAIDVFRKQPIQVIMPVKNGEKDCKWNRIYQHELEHVRITLATPKSFEQDIRDIAENSTNPNSEMIRLIWRIEQETARRQDQFHKFESRIVLDKTCKTSKSFANMTW